MAPLLRRRYRSKAKVKMSLRNTAHEDVKWSELVYIVFYAVGNELKHSTTDCLDLLPTEERKLDSSRFQTSEFDGRKLDFRARVRCSNSSQKWLFRIRIQRLECYVYSLSPNILLPYHYRG
jgi:hypothetical protein